MVYMLYPLYAFDTFPFVFMHFAQKRTCALILLVGRQKGTLSVYH